MLWSLNEIYKALDITNSSSEKINFDKISIDSRNIKKKNFFIPIVGKNFDGHNFIDEISKIGVRACLIEKKKAHLIKNKKIHKIFVNDTGESLKKLASFARQRVKNLTMICITGSSGKTTLKEWLTTILKAEEKIFFNYGNFNNLIGMPLTLVNMPLTTKFCILELGMNQYGEIKELSKIAQPNISVITNIGTAHIGNFKNKIEIAKEKSDIFEFLTKKSTALVPGDTSYFKTIFNKANEKTDNIIVFGKNENFDFRFKKKNDNHFEFFILNENITIKKNYNFSFWENNILIVLSILKILNININKLRKKIESLEPLKGRGEITKIKNKSKNFYLYDESYNSNPQALESAINNLNKIKNKKKIIVIGDMLELGDYSKKFHKNIIKPIIKLMPKLVITVGKKDCKIINELLPKTIKNLHYKTYSKVYERLIEEINDNDIVMIKGSNSINLSYICDKLKSNNP